LHKSAADALKAFATVSPGVVILSEKLGETTGLELAREMLRLYPATQTILLAAQESSQLYRDCFKAGVQHLLTPPFKTEDVHSTVRACLDSITRQREAILLNARRSTSNLQHKVSELEALARLGRAVTGSLDIEEVLTAIVESAVELTSAEEGSLLLLDEKTDELYMRAARNFNEDFVHTFHLPMNDTLAGSVIQTGKPMVIDEKTPQKIKTSYLVHSLIYVPLIVNERTIGVLGVDNRTTRLPFSQHDLHLLTALSEFVVIALANARMYEAMETDRNQLETILTNIQDGVVVLNQTQQIIFVNQVVRRDFHLENQDLEGKPFVEFFCQPEFIDLMEVHTPKLTTHLELTLDDDRVLSVNSTPIPNVGVAITLHDITQLKRIDRIKTEFVNTVSHDLRSPLTAILGYSELVERIGPISETQREFLHRVQTSVRNITALVDDLLNLGRIEAGFETRREAVYLDQLVHFCLETLSLRIEQKFLTVETSLPENLPPIAANPVHMREMVENLVDNAIKYTPAHGIVRIHLEVAQSQIIFQVADSGVGIPPADMSFIFDKFYRASNAVGLATGSGLGLSIVKSIVEAHAGRIWVDSTPGNGATFTVVLPIHAPEPPEIDA
jgi:two-component system, OmpR family, phosphate regulon sensor histidine kinase PhoR